MSNKLSIHFLNSSYYLIMKNIRSDITEFRKNKGFKTKDVLMRSIEEHCRSNEIKPFGDKTLQRMENEFIASEKTINIVASVLNVSPDDLKIDKTRKKLPKTEDIPLERFSEINLMPLRTIKSPFFNKNISVSTKRKFIIDVGRADNWGQHRATKQFMSLIDNYSKIKADPINEVKSDNFGSQEELKKMFDLEDDIQELIDALVEGYEFESSQDSYDSNPIVYAQSQRGKKLNPIYIYYGLHPFTTYWPYPKSWWKDNTPLGQFTEYFDGEDSLSTFNPNKPNEYILAPVSNLYSFFVLCRHPKLQKITYNNLVSKTVLEDMDIVYKKQQNGDFSFKNLGTKIIGKSYTASTFKAMLKTISEGLRSELPNNILKDFNFIYGSEDKLNFDNGMPKDPDDWRVETQIRQDKCYEIITNDSRFYNVVKFDDWASLSKSFTLDDNLDQKSRQAWIKKKNYKIVLEEYVSKLLPYYDYNVKKTCEIILEGGKTLTKALEKSGPYSYEDI